MIAGTGQVIQFCLDTRDAVHDVAAFAL